MKLLLILLVLLLPGRKQRRKTQKKWARRIRLAKRLSGKQKERKQKRTNPLRRIRNAFRVISALAIGLTAWSLAGKAIHLGKKTVSVYQKLTKRG